MSRSLSLRIAAPILVGLTGLSGFSLYQHFLADAAPAASAESTNAESTDSPQNLNSIALKLSPQALKNLDIVTQKVGPVNLEQALVLPGQIAVDEHRLKAVTSRFGGVIIQMPKHAGQRVQQGELLAVLESRELADLKLDYFQQKEQQQQADRLVQQQQSIKQGVSRLITLLRSKAPFEKIQTEVLNLKIGTPKTTLLNDYTHLKNTAEILKRESELYRDQLSSEQDLLRAKQNYETAQARYIGSLEEVARHSENQLYEAQLNANLAKNAAQTAAHKLTGMGIALQNLNPGADAALHRYAIYAPMSGTLIEKKVAEGENISAETLLYKIADLSEVWAETQIYESDIPQIKVGTPVTIYAENQAYSAPGKLVHMKPLVNEDTRTAEAHAEIPNPKGVWFPGMFITLKVHQTQKFVPLGIQKEALQTIDGTAGVFVETPEGYRFQAVKTGLEGDQAVEVLGGLKAGERYVAKNSFVLKSELLGQAEN